MLNRITFEVFTEFCNLVSLALLPALGKIVYFRFFTDAKGWRVPEPFFIERVGSIVPDFTAEDEILGILLFFWETGVSWAQLSRARLRGDNNDSSLSLSIPSETFFKSIRESDETSCSRDFSLKFSTVSLPFNLNVVPNFPVRLTSKSINLGSSCSSSVATIGWTGSGWGKLSSNEMSLTEKKNCHG